MTLVLGLTSCGKSNFSIQKLTKQEYLAWYAEAEQETRVTKEFSGLTFALHYRPAALQLIQEEKEATAENLKAYEAFQLFNLSIVPIQPKTISDYLTIKLNEQQLAYYCSFDFAHSLYAEQDGKQFKAEIFHFVKSIETFKSLDFVVGFNGIDHQKPFDVLLQDELFGNGKIKYHYAASYFNSHPHLKIQSHDPV